MQPGFFDRDERLTKLEALGDPLPKVARLVNWEGFRPLLEKTREKRDPRRGGRPAYDAVLMFKVLVLQHLYNLSDDQIEYQIRDRYSFSGFLGLSAEQAIPDAKTVWLYRERLKNAGLVEGLFSELLRQIEAAGFVPRRGQIVDAAIVAAPKQRNRREDNQKIKAGELPEHWSPAQRRQKDTEARWAVKYGRAHFGYKNHISIDTGAKLIRGYQVTSASVHDGQVFEQLLGARNTHRGVWADAAYHSRARLAALRAAGYRSHLQRQSQASRPLTERQRLANRKHARVRCRIEHVFAQQSAMNQRLVRTIGLARATVKIALMNFTYNLRRWAYLMSHTPQALAG